MKDQKKIRLGLIGVGYWALFAHVRVLRLLPEYEIVAIYSQRKKAAKAAATEDGIPHVAESLDALVRGAAARSSDSQGRILWSRGHYFPLQDRGRSDSPCQYH